MTLMQHEREIKEEAREEALEEGRALGLEAGRELGLEVGRELGLEKGIKGTIKLCLTLGMSSDQIKEKLMTVLDMTEAEAEQSIYRYVK